MVKIQQDNQTAPHEELSTRDASGGIKFGAIRYVLVIGTALAVIAMIIVWKSIAH